MPLSAPVLCAACWHTAGGAAALTARVRGTGIVAELPPPPGFLAQLLDASWYDRLHPNDRYLVDSGIRWSTLRRIARPARNDLIRWIQERPLPAHTCSALSAQLWLDEVAARIQAQSGPRGSTAEFRYESKRQHYLAVARVFGALADEQRRPLTWITQAEIAAAIDGSTRTVKRAVRWLCAEQLLHEVVPGCQLPRQHVPDDETPAERAARRQRLAAAVAAEDAARARARGRAQAELAAVRQLSLDETLDPAHRRALVDAALAGLDDADGEDTDLDQAVTDELGTTAPNSLVQLAPVYELRVPRDADELTDWAPMPPVTSQNLAGHEIGTPPRDLFLGALASIPQQPVDEKRPAPPGSNTERVGRSGGVAAVPDRQAPEPICGPRTAAARPRRPHPKSQAVQAAEWLLRSKLRPDLCDGVAPSWLADRIRHTQLLHHGWTWHDLLDQINGQPDYPHLPYQVYNPRAWITARLQRADPDLSPTQRRLLDVVEHSRLFARYRDEDAAADRRTRRQAAIDDCTYCDSDGLLHIDDTAGAVFTCNHRDDTFGY